MPRLRPPPTRATHRLRNGGGHDEHLTIGAVDVVRNESVGQARFQPGRPGQHRVRSLVAHVDPVDAPELALCPQSSRRFTFAHVSSTCAGDTPTASARAVAHTQSALVTIPSRRSIARRRTLSSLRSTMRGRDAGVSAPSTVAANVIGAIADRKRDPGGEARRHHAAGDGDRLGRRVGVGARRISAGSARDGRVGGAVGAGVVRATGAGWVVCRVAVAGRIRLASADSIGLELAAAQPPRRRTRRSAGRRHAVRAIPRLGDRPMRSPARAVGPYLGVFDITKRRCLSSEAPRSGIRRRSCVGRRH